MLGSEFWKFQRQNSGRSCERNEGEPEKPNEKVPDVADAQHHPEDEEIVMAEGPLSTFPNAESASVGIGMSKFEEKLLEIEPDLKDWKVSH